MSSGDRIVCFFLEGTDLCEVSLRRFVWNDRSPCTGRMGYHNADVVIGQEPAHQLIANNLDGDGTRRHDRKDPRWPSHCSCGYEFAATDEWQANRNRLYKRSDTGGLTTIVAAPVGAMWFADWYQRSPRTALYHGPDGHCLVVKTPGGDWIVDGGSSSSRDKPGWTRSGTPPLVVAQPSILIHPTRKRDGSILPDGYHGWLGGPTGAEPGVLVEC